MKQYLLIIFVFTTAFLHSQVSINTSGSAPHASAMLDITSTTKGVLIPRMTTTERNAINGGSPETSLMIFNTSTNTYNYWNGTAWISMAAGNIKELSDADGNTKVEVEKNVNEDKIRFTTNGY
ncbi:MAG: hypothetical protein ABIQ02_13000, partial [Saprospiraceae bacterium]